MIDLPPHETLTPVPDFPVEAPDGVKTWTELQRQSAFIKEMRTIAPTVMIFANANAGKRNPRQAKREGIVGGVFDLTCTWEGGSAWCEWKGYTKAGRAGRLSPAQIDWGNKMHARGKAVACFFTPAACVAWLRGLGAPFVTREGL
ncbi:MAG: hypothetical protein ACKVOB_13565 [Sphingomonas sp.]